MTICRRLIVAIRDIEDSRVIYIPDEVYWAGRKSGIIREWPVTVRTARRLGATNIGMRQRESGPELWADWPQHYFAPVGPEVQS